MGFLYVPSFAADSLKRDDALKMIVFFANPSWYMTRKHGKSWSTVPDKSGKYGLQIESLGGEAFIDLCKSLSGYFEGKSTLKLMRRDPRIRYMQIFNFALFFFQKCRSKELTPQYENNEMGNILLDIFMFLNDIFVLKKDFVTGKKISLDVEETSRFYMVLRQIIMYLFALEAREKRQIDYGTKKQMRSKVLTSNHPIYDEPKKEGKLIKHLKIEGTYFIVNANLKERIKKLYSDLFHCKEFEDFRMNNFSVIAPYVEKAYSEAF